MRNKKAYWTKISHIIRNDEFQCSKCGRKAAKPLPRCPHCGAEMTGRKREDPQWIDEMAFIDILLGDD